MVYLGQFRCARSTCMPGRTAKGNNPLSRCLKRLWREWRKSALSFLLKMLPSLVSDNSKNSDKSGLMLNGQKFQLFARPAAIHLRSYLQNLSISKCSPVMSFIMRAIMTISDHLIPHILLMRASIKMPWIKTRRVIATVQDLKALWNRSYQQFPTGAPTIPWIFMSPATKEQQKYRAEIVKCYSRPKSSHKRVFGFLRIILRAAGITTKFRVFISTLKYSAATKAVSYFHSGTVT